MDVLTTLARLLLSLLFIPVVLEEHNIIEET